MVKDRSPVLDRAFHALAHPVRRAIIRRLTDGERNLSDLAAPLRMSFPAAAKHVRVLEKAKLIRRRKSGREQLCSLNAAPLRDIQEWTEQYRQHWEARFQVLDQLLLELQQQKPDDPRR